MLIRKKSRRIKLGRRNYFRKVSMRKKFTRIKPVQMLETFLEPLRAAIFNQHFIKQTFVTPTTVVKLQRPKPTLKKKLQKLFKIKQKFKRLFFVNYKYLKQRHSLVLRLKLKSLDKNRNAVWYYKKYFILFVRSLFERDRKRKFLHKWNACSYPQLTKKVSPYVFKIHNYFYRGQRKALSRLPWIQTKFIKISFGSTKKFFFYNRRGRFLWIPNICAKRLQLWKQRLKLFNNTTKISRAVFIYKTVLHETVRKFQFKKNSLIKGIPVFSMLNTTNSFITEKKLIGVPLYTKNALMLNIKKPIFRAYLEIAFIFKKTIFKSYKQKIRLNWYYTPINQKLFDIKLIFRQIDIQGKNSVGACIKNYLPPILSYVIKPYLLNFNRSVALYNHKTVSLLVPRKKLKIIFRKATKSVTQLNSYSLWLESFYSSFDSRIFRFKELFHRGGSVLRKIYRIIRPKKKSFWWKKKFFPSRKRYYEITRYQRRYKFFYKAPRVIIKRDFFLLKLLLRRFFRYYLDVRDCFFSFAKAKRNQALLSYKLYSEIYFIFYQNYKINWNTLLNCSNQWLLKNPVRRILRQRRNTFVLKKKFRRFVPFLLHKKNKIRWWIKNFGYLIALRKKQRGRQY